MDCDDESPKSSLGNPESRGINQAELHAIAELSKWALDGLFAVALELAVEQAAHILEENSTRPQRCD